VSAIVPAILSIWKPLNFNWQDMQTHLTLVESDDVEVVRRSTTLVKLYKTRKWTRLIACTLAFVAKIL